VTTALPELELLDLSALDPAEGVGVRVERDVKGWWPVAAAFGVAGALLLTGKSSHAPAPAAPSTSELAAPTARAAAALPSTPPSSFSIVLRDTLSGHFVLVDPTGEAVRLATTAEGGLPPLDVSVPTALDVSLGGLPPGRRPVAVLDKSIVLVPSASAGPPVELWGGGSNLQVVDDVGKFVAASDDRVATVDQSCTSCTLRISRSVGGLVEEIAPFDGFQPVATGSFSPDGRYFAVRFAEEHRPFDGVAIADLQERTIEPITGVGGDDALAMEWSPDSRLFLLGPKDVLEYEPGVGVNARIPIGSWPPPGP
jgi:hypothetical protein